jgi:ubiquitin-protein ligase
MSLRLRRLKSDYEAIRRLVHLHPRIEIEGVSGNPPDRYIFKLHVRSLRERGDSVVLHDEHRLEIKLPLGYPRDAPLCRMLTPVFHPNIAPHAVCIGDHWSAAESLDLMIQRVGEMLGYQSYNIKSPLNGRAAQWVDEHVSEVPTDARDFFIDVASASAHAPADAPAGRCANCGATEAPFEDCGRAHALCRDCLVRCPTCSRLLCLVCGESRCATCTAACANCGADTTEPLICEGAHRLCGDCGLRCQSCERVLCLVCGSYPCTRCAA